MKHRRLFQQSFLAISSVFFAFPYFLMLFCCFSTDAGIKGNTLFGSLSVDHFLSNLSLFKSIAELSAAGMLSKELSIFEEEKAEELEALKIWKDDVWVQNWCKIEPKLANEDLTLYFYFTRTSLDEKVKYMSSKLSPTAQDIFDKLITNACKYNIDRLVCLRYTVNYRPRGL